MTDDEELVVSPEEIEAQDNDEGLIYIEGDPSIEVPDTPGAKFAQAMCGHSADLFSHLSRALAEYRRQLPPEWWSYFPIIGSIALHSYAKIFNRDVHESFDELVKAASDQLASRALDGLMDHRKVD